MRLLPLFALNENQGQAALRKDKEYICFGIYHWQWHISKKKGGVGDGVDWHVTFNLITLLWQMIFLESAPTMKTDGYVHINISYQR